MGKEENVSTFNINFSCIIAEYIILSVSLNVLHSVVIRGFFLVGYCKGLVWYKWVNTANHFFLPYLHFLKTQSSVHRIIVITCVLSRSIHSLRIYTSFQYISYRASAHACMNHCNVVCVLTCTGFFRFLFASAF